MRARWYGDSRPARRRGLPEPLASSSCPVPGQPRQSAALGGASPGAERGAGGPLGGPSSGLGSLGTVSASSCAPSMLRREKQITGGVGHFSRGGSLVALCSLQDPSRAGACTLAVGRLPVGSLGFREGLEAFISLGPLAHRGLGAWYPDFSCVQPFCGVRSAGAARLLAQRPCLRLSRHVPVSGAADTGRGLG